MNKAIAKLIAALMALVLSVAMIVTITYAWMTLSSTPVVEGIQITIGGGNTILVAANLSETVDGVTYNYPGRFSDTLNFGLYEEYDYLNNLAPLSPVSTADGIYWFLPERYDAQSDEVKKGTAMAGTLKPISEFEVDSTLKYANLPVTENQRAANGNYIYVDFWVVSPGTDYTLRISKGDSNSGSYVIELMSPEEADNGYTLVESSGSVAASARLGFLVNPDNVVDDSMLYYQRSPGFSSQYTRLRGSYGDQSLGFMWHSSQYKFTIYEPNGDLHTDRTDGSYYITEPIAWNGERAVLADIRDNLTVQLCNSWRTQTTAAGISIEEMFQTAILGKDISTPQEASDIFYSKYLQRQYMPYVIKGEFIKRTSDLYALGGSGYVTDDNISIINQAGATDDVYITTLEKDVPQRIRMFVWLEGQDIDCNDSIENVNFAISIELAGSNKEEE